MRTPCVRACLSPFLSPGYECVCVSVSEYERIPRSGCPRVVPLNRCPPGHHSASACVMVSFACLRVPAGLDSWVSMWEVGSWVQPLPPLQFSGDFSSLYSIFVSLSSPPPTPVLGPSDPHPPGPPFFLTPRFRQVRLKHRKLREQVNSMVDISKVLGSHERGSRRRGR